MKRILIPFALISLFFVVCTKNNASSENAPQNEIQTNMVEKESIGTDGIVRLSKIEVYPQYLSEYLEYAKEVGETSLLTEPGVLTMYAMQDKNDSCRITILETYSSQDAYQSHIASPHFQKYKQGTLHMVKTLELSDQTPLNPQSTIINYISE